jgi:predicted membrane protein
MNSNNNTQKNDGSKVVAGIILVGVGIVLLLRNIGFLFPHWLFTWPVIVILAGIYTGFKHNFKNNSWLIIIAVGSFFLIERFMPSVSLQPYFWPLIIIGIGVLYILRPGKQSWNNWKNTSDGNNKWNETGKWQGFSGDTSVDNNDEFRVNSIFSGVEKKIISKNFQRGQISSVFGGAEIDMTQADIAGTAVIKMEVVFGGVKILLPPHWSVQNNIDGVFHSVEDNRNGSAAAADTAKLLILEGRCIFGGIEIKSY